MVLQKEKQTKVNILLRPSQKEFLDKKALFEGISLSALIRRVVDDYQTSVTEKQLEDAAMSLYSEYETNDDLTAFTALDGDDFA